VAVVAAVERGEPYGVAFVDYVMPDLNGREVAERIRWTDPHVELVIVTGDRGVRLDELAGAVPPEDKLLFLAKPFDRREKHQLDVALGTK